MMVLLISLLVLVVGVVVGVLVGKIGSGPGALDGMAPAARTSAFELPKGRLGSAGADVIKLDQSLRGYNMVQTDAVLDKLFGELADLESEVARLRSEASGVTRPTSLASTAAVPTTDGPAAEGSTADGAAKRHPHEGTSARVTPLRPRPE